MNRLDLQSLSSARLADATILLEAGRFAGAYYLLGYSEECAFKACIAKQIREHEFPDRKLVNDSYTHDLERLLGLSSLKEEFDARGSTDQQFVLNWTTVKDWTESARYEAELPEPVARSLFSAVTDPMTGVLPWLRTLW